MRRGLLGCVGSVVLKVSKPRSRYRPIRISPNLSAIQRRLRGKRVVEIERLGKRVVVRFDSGDRLVLQPKMAGLVLVGQPPNLPHSRLVIDLDGPATPIIYWDQRGLGTVQLWSPVEYELFLASGQLGPDALAVDSMTFFQRFASSHRPVKPALLDQSRIAGIGNLYASEILHRVKINPRVPCSSLTRAHWKRIHRATLDVLLTAIEYEGSTLSDGSYRNALDQPGSYQNAHRVYDREGKPCFRCKNVLIERIVQAQRSTFLCPRCQK